MKSIAMRKQSPLSAMLILFLLVPASITWAQVTKTLNGTVRYEFGMYETRFSTPNGDVLMKLPQSLSGPVITGTVSAEPSGNTEKEKSKNLKELLKFVIKLDGQQIPLSATAQNFDWATHMDRHQRTPVELLNEPGVKVFELSLPAVLSTPSPMGGWQSNDGPVLGTPSRLLVKGDMLNVYTNQQFKPGEKFVLTDSKGQQFNVKPVCLSANQAVITVPDKAVTGELTVIEEVWSQPNVSKAARVILVDISLSSPNTNLRPGQISNVQVVLNTGSNNRADQGSALATIDPKITEKDSAEAMQIPVMSIDLRNLNPNTVTMEGGNLQRVKVNYSKKTLVSGEQTVLWFTLNRNITGNAVGSFSVSATLHEDYTSSNDPFRPQLNVLKTPEDFNAWTNTLKKDLKELAGMHDNDLLGQAARTNVQRAIDNMPVCSDPRQLDECKAVAYSLVQPLNVPKGAAIHWLSSYEASKAAVHPISNILSGTPDLVNYDVIKNGVEFINRIAGQVKDASLQTESIHVQQLIDKIQTTSESKENLQDLKDKLNTLASNADAKIGTDPYRNYKYTMQDLLVSSYVVSNDGWSDRPPIQFEQTELKEPRKLEDKALQIGLHMGIKKLIADAAGARGQTWNTVCDNCRGCIEARMGEWAADLVKDLGVGIIKEYLGAAVSLIGEAVKAVGAAKEFFDKISDKVDNAEKLADDIADKIKKGELQVMALEPKFCVKSEYCQTRGTIFYNPKTGCVFAIIYCEGSKLCCPNAQTIITMTYCTDDKGMPTQVPDIDVIKK